MSGEDGGALRALLTTAALWVFAESNPLASSEQLSEFAAQYDVLLAQAMPGDPDLRSYGSVHAALSQRHVVE